MARIADFIVKGDAQNALPFNLKEAAKKAVYPIFKKEKEYPNVIFCFEGELKERKDRKHLPYLQLRIQTETGGFIPVSFYGTSMDLKKVVENKGGTFHCSIEKKFLDPKKFVRVVNLRIKSPEGNQKILMVGSGNEIPSGYKRS
ncbi:hypothetical protein KC929_01675 [Patescibacteria group bacterium]|nr:hypothetical protein [Patescibacteria group bacterium]